MKYPAIFAALIACAGSSSLAQEPVVQEAPFVTPFLPTIRCELLVVRLPVAKAMALQKELRDVQTIGKGIEKLLGFIEKNQAELVDWPVLTTLAGNRAVAENVREVRYPIEFEMPQAVLPTPPPSPDGENVTQPSATEVAKAPEPAAGAGANLPAKLKINHPPAKTEVALAGAGPTSFETANVGVTFEIEPKIGEDGDTIEMNVAPQHKSLMGYRREIFEVEGQYKLAIQQPTFDMQKTATNTKLKSGQSQLIGFYKVQEPKDTVELQILTVTIVDKAPAKTPRGGGPEKAAGAPGR